MAEFISAGSPAGAPGLSDPSLQVTPVVSNGPGLSLRGRRTPIVVRVKGKKKKRKYSRSLKGLGRNLEYSLKGGDRLASAFSAGFRKFRRRSLKSSRKRKDGLLKDLNKNYAAGLGTVLRKSSNVPYILSKSVKTKKVGRRLRALAKATGMFR